MCTCARIAAGDVAWIIILLKEGKKRSERVILYARSCIIYTYTYK